MENYKEKYEQALGRARTFIQRWDGVEINSDLPLQELKEIFPELKESDDEKIRKSLIKSYTNQHSANFPTVDGFTREQILAWLEKQGEQKPEELPKGEDYGIDSLYHAARILEKTLGDVEGYQSDDGILEHKCAIEAVNRLYKQKPAWSEEVKRMFIKALERVEEQNNKGYKLTDCDKNSWWEDFKACCGYTEMQKSAWNEEDEKTIDEAISLINMLASGYGEKVTEPITFNGVKMINNIKERLRNLHQKPNHWKPSDEQMNFLWKYAEQNNYDGAVLTSLFRDLKKLREE